MLSVTFDSIIQKFNPASSTNEPLRSFRGHVLLRQQSFLVKLLSRNVMGRQVPRINVTDVSMQRSRVWYLEMFAYVSFHRRSA
jgi:hypothetical protein